MIFYLVIIQNDTTTTIFNYSTFEAALASYHTELAYRSDDRISTKCMIFNSNMDVLRAEIYEAPVAETAEPEIDEPVDGI